MIIQTGSANSQCVRSANHRSETSCSVGPVAMADNLQYAADYPLYQLPTRTGAKIAPDQRFGTEQRDSIASLKTWLQLQERGSFELIQGEYTELLTLYGCTDRMGKHVNDDYGMLEGFHSFIVRKQQTDETKHAINMRSSNQRQLCTLVAVQTLAQCFADARMHLATQQQHLYYRGQRTTDV